MTPPAYLSDPYLRAAPAGVSAQTEGGLVLSAPIFYPRGGGQPGDSGRLDWDGGSLGIADTVKGPDDACLLIPAGDGPRPAPGQDVTQVLDWDRRHAHMRVHTALHLLSVVIPLPVTGGAIGPGKGRLDFLMPEPPEDRDALEAALNGLIVRDLPVTQDWIAEAELDANPGLVKTMSVQPPHGAGRIRLIRIGDGADRVDLQPCGGTHVAGTAEIGRVRLGKIENKGRQNRRVNILLDDG